MPKNRSTIEPRKSLGRALTSSTGGHARSHDSLCAHACETLPFTSALLAASTASMRSCMRMRSWHGALPARTSAHAAARQGPAQRNASPSCCSGTLQHAPRNLAAHRTGESAARPHAPSAAPQDTACTVRPAARSMHELQWTAAMGGPFTASGPAPCRMRAGVPPGPFPLWRTVSLLASRAAEASFHMRYPARASCVQPRSLLHTERARAARPYCPEAPRSAPMATCMRICGHRPTAHALLDPKQRVRCTRAAALRAHARRAGRGGRPHLSLPCVRRMLRAHCAPTRRAARPPAPGARSLVVQERLMLRAHGAARAPDRAVALEAAAKGELPDAVAALDALPRPPRALNARWHAGLAGLHDRCNRWTGP